MKTSSAVSTKPKTNLELIDHAIEDVREVCHRVGINPVGREHLNFAIAFLREAWIACDGQHAQSPEQIVEGRVIFKRLESMARSTGTSL